MQEIPEGNLYNMEDTFGAGTNASETGLKKVKEKIKSQILDIIKRNKMKQGKKIIQKTFDKLLEDVDIGDFEGIGDSEGLGSIIGKDNQTGAGVVIVTNPKGESVTKAPGFGMGFALNPALLPNVQQFIQQYSNLSGNKESDKFELSRSLEDIKSGENPGEDVSMTWQKINNAVANYITQNLNKTLEKYNIAPIGGIESVTKTETTSNISNFGYDPYSRQVFRIKGFRGENK